MRRMLLSTVLASLVAAGAGFASAPPAAAATCASGYTLTQGTMTVTYYFPTRDFNMTYTAQGCYNGSRSYGAAFPRRDGGGAALNSTPGYAWNGRYTDYWADWYLGSEANSWVGTIWYYAYPRIQLWPDGHWGQWNYEKIVVRHTDGSYTTQSGWFSNVRVVKNW